VMAKKLCGPWMLDRAFCGCGMSFLSPFGSPWYAEEEHPVCPACGHGANYSMRQYRLVWGKRGPRDLLWRFRKGRREFFDEQDKIHSVGTTEVPPC
jgi:ribosomal protein L37E